MRVKKGEREREQGRNVIGYFFTCFTRCLRRHFR